MNPILVGIRIKNKTWALLSCLNSLSNQHLKDYDIFIYDESDTPISEDPHVQVLLDKYNTKNELGLQNIQIKITYESKGAGNVAQALVKVLNYVKDNEYPYFLMLDSDMDMEPECLWVLYKYIQKLDAAYVIPTTLDVNNILGHKDYTLKQYQKKASTKFSEWGLNHQMFKFNPIFGKTSKTTATIPLINMKKINKESYNDIIKGLKKLGKRPAEDIMMYHYLGNCYLITEALGWHLTSKGDHRHWMPTYTEYDVVRKLQNDVAEKGIKAL